MADVKGSLGMNAEELKKIVTDYYEDIYRFCYWKVTSKTDAQDLTQEVFLHFIEKIDNYSDLGKPKALLYTIAKHLCINHLKKLKVASLDGTTAYELLSAEDSSNAVIDKVDLSNAISTLSELQQEVLLLRYGQDMRIGEIASILSVSRFTVMYRLRCAVAQLKKITKEADNL